MSEFFFTLKCLVFAAVFLLILQVQIAGRSLDDRMMDVVERSPVAGFIGDSSEGGAKILRRSYASAKSWIQNRISSNEVRKVEKSRSQLRVEQQQQQMRPKRYLDQPSDEETLEY